MSQVNVWLRSKEKLVLTALCCILMVTFVIGGSTMVSLFKPAPIPDGRIFGKKVSGGDVFNLARQLALFTDSDRGFRKEMLLALAWDVTISLEEAKRYGIRASDADLNKALAQRFPLKDGGLDFAAYRNFLGRHAVNRGDYEDTLKSLLTAQKVRAMVQESVTLPGEEAWRWYSRDNERVKARYIQIQARDLAPLVNAEESELKSFYKQYRDTENGKGPYGAGYLEPEKVRIEYVFASAGKFGKDAKISDKQIEERYEADKDKLFRKPPSPKKDSDKAKAKKDDKKAEKPEKEEIAYKPLAEVRKQIERTLRKEAGDKKVDAVMKEVNEAIWKALDVDLNADEEPTVDLAALAKRFKLDYRKTGLFSADEIPTILPGASDLKERAFGQSLDNVGVAKPVLKARDGKFTFKLLEIKRPSPAPFEKVRDKVEEHLRLKKASELALEIVSNAVGAADLDAAGKIVEEAVANLLKDAGDKVKKKKATDYYRAGESKAFTRPREFYGGRKFHYGSGLPGNFNSVNFAEVAFHLKDGEVGMADDSDPATPIEERRVNAVYLLQRSGVELPDREKFDAEKARIVPRLLRSKRQEVLAAWRQDLRRRAHPSEEVMKFLRLLPDWAG